MTVTLRRMRWWDIESAAQLERELFPDDAWTVEGFWGELAGWPDTRHYVVAEDEQGLAGYAGVIVTAGDADVATVGVRPDVRRQGIGTALLSELIDAARRRRCDALLLEVRADNPGAITLYEGAGFVALSARRGYFDNGRVDAVIMRLLLETA